MKRNVSKKLAAYLLVLVVFLIAASGCSNRMQEEPKTDEDLTEVNQGTCQLCPKIQSNQDTLEFVNEVRQFLASNCDDGLMQHALTDSFKDIPRSSFPVDDFLSLFRNDSATATVSLISTLMHIILHQNNIDSYIYKFGLDNETHSHSVVLFKMNNKIYVTDPYINYTIVDSSGTPLSIDAMIKLVGSKKTHLIGTNSKPVETDFLVDKSLASKGIIERLKSSKCNNLWETSKTIRSTIQLMKGQRCFSCDKSNSCISFINRFESQLKAKTDLNSFWDGFVLKQGSVYGASDQMEVDDLIESSIYSQPNLGKRVRKKAN